MASQTEVESKSYSVRLVCRYCLDSSDSNKVGFITDDNKIYEKIVKETFNIQVYDMKSFNKLCLECAKKLHYAAEIKNKIMVAQETLLAKSGKLFDNDCELVKQELLENDFEMDVTLTDALTDSDEILDKDDPFIKIENEDFALSDINNDCEDDMICTKEVKVKIEPLEDSTESGKISSENNDTENIPKEINEEIQLKTSVKKRVTSKKGSLKWNMNIHTGEKPYKCKVCNYQTTRKSHLELHIRTHTGEKPFHCNICDYKSSLNNSLKRHMSSHTGEKPYQCSFCGYKCSQKGNLKIHIRIHTGEKPFECNFCDYKCSARNSLTGHLRRHTGEKPFECNV